MMSQTGLYRVWGEFINAVDKFSVVKMASALCVHAELRSIHLQSTLPISPRLYPPAPAVNP